MSSQDEVLEFGPLRLYLGRYQAYLSGQRLDLTPNEFRLLSVLVRRQGAVASYDTLLEVIGVGKGGRANTVRNYIRRLREKVHQASDQKCRILTVHALGYQLAYSAPGSATAEGNPRPMELPDLGQGWMPGSYFDFVPTGSRFLAEWPNTWGLPCFWWMSKKEFLYPCRCDE